MVAGRARASSTPKCPSARWGLVTLSGTHGVPLRAQLEGRARIIFNPEKSISHQTPKKVHINNGNQSIGVGEENNHSL